MRVNWQERTFLFVGVKRGGNDLYRPEEPGGDTSGVAHNAHDHRNQGGCRALASVLAQVGDKWTILVVGVLSLNRSRFNALQRSIPGISHRMLTLTLRGLERDGLVKRTAFAEIPPRVEYELTALGHSLTKPLAQLAKWASANRLSIETSRAVFDQVAGASQYWTKHDEEKALKGNANL